MNKVSEDEVFGSLAGNLRKYLYGLKNDHRTNGYQLTFNLGDDKEKAKEVVEAMFNVEDCCWEDERYRLDVLGALLKLDVRFIKDTECNELDGDWSLGTDFQNAVEEKKWYEMLRDSGAEIGIEPVEAQN